MNFQAHNEEEIRPLCVDLDGTLIHSDWLHEALACFITKYPWKIFQVATWAIGGPAKLKYKLLEQVQVPVNLLPYNQELIEYLKNEKNKRRTIFLVSASPLPVLQEVDKYLQLFSDVMGTSKDYNLKANNKAELLVNKFGQAGFDYIGDSHADIPVWNKCHTAHIVGNKKLADKISSKNIGQTFLASHSNLYALVKALRAHQWVKNLLIFVPALMAHSISQPLVFIQCIYAFIAFSLCASAIYLINDLVDLDSDRKHAVKKGRPFASGKLALKYCAVLLPLLFLSSFTISSLVSINFSIILLGYIIITALYSFWLKQIVLIDIFVLASLYSIRIIAGAVATQTYVSPWLLAFSMFMFLSLACVKRVTELYDFKQFASEKIPGRGYLGQDYEQIVKFGTISGYLSVLVLALYISNPAVVKLYSHADFLWGLCPVLLFWISRIWLLTTRGQVHVDPIVFALQDKVSFVVGALSLIFLYLAI